jgi:hypothetical protein
MPEIVTIKKLKLESEEIDAISFSIDRKNAENIEWNFTMMKLNDRKSEEFHLYDMGYKYQIALYNNRRVEVFEAIIGDLDYYVKNMVNMNQEGIILKKCKKSEEILDKIFRGNLMDALKVGIVEIAEQKV